MWIARRRDFSSPGNLFLFDIVLLRGGSRLRLCLKISWCFAAQSAIFWPFFSTFGRNDQVIFKQALSDLREGNRMLSSDDYQEAVRRYKNMKLDGDERPQCHALILVQQ